jgi:hypothetical protein
MNRRLLTASELPLIIQIKLDKLTIFMRILQSYVYLKETKSIKNIQIMIKLTKFLGKNPPSD